MSPTVTRRTFLESVAGGVALSAFGRATLLSRQATPQVPAGPNDQIVLGMIGVGRQGMSRLREFLRHADTRIARDLRRRSRPRRSARSPRSRKCAGTSRKPSATFAAPRRSRDRRGRRRHARPLARDSDGPRVRGGEGRVRREAAELQRRRGAHDGRCLAEVQARQPDGQSHPQRPSPTTGGSSRSCSPGSSDASRACTSGRRRRPSRDADHQAADRACDARL